MKRALITIYFALISVSLFAQSASQLEQLQNLTPAQIEALKKAQGDSYVAPVTKIGDKTVQRAERRYKATDTVRTTIGKQPIPTKYEKLLRAPGDSITLTKDEYIALQMRKDRDSITVFGRDIFRSDNLSFAPSMSIPTPENYVISAGDQLLIDMWGAAEAAYELKVSPEGNISIPNVGLINVAGLTVAEAQRRIKSKLTSAVAGLSDGTVNIKVTLGDIRSIKVNIIGEARTPGTYTLPSLATLFNALYVAGGVSDIGSLRNIKLYRAGKEIATLDVYDYLLNGKQEVNMPLKDNDQIVVMPYENIVQIAGKVKRPKLYELKKGETAAKLIEYAGGFAGDAYSENISVARRSGGRQFSMHTVQRPEFEDFLIFDRDSIAVGEILKTYANRVSIEGAVWRNGDFELSEKLKTVGDLLKMAEGLSDDAFAGRAQIVRTKADKTLQIISFNAGKVLTGQAEDIALQKDDKVIITSIKDLTQGQTITIRGEVNDPRIMPFAQGMTLEDLIILSKGLKESASRANIEVARRIINPGSKEFSPKKAEIFTFTIPSDLSLTSDAAQFTLSPYDQVYIRRSPGYSEQVSVTVDGEVLFSGIYVMQTSSDKLSTLIAKAGGVTPDAYIKGAYLRRLVTEEDMQRINSLTKLMERTKKRTDSVKVDIVKTGDYFPIGIDLVSALNNPNGAANLTLRSGDILVVPTFNNTVKISGAVNYPNTTSYVTKAHLADYIDKAGGYSDMAKRKPFVVYMNGTVAATMGGRIPKIEPGCEIVVPQRAEREPMNAQGWVSLGSSVVSMAAMIVSILK